MTDWDDSAERSDQAVQRPAYAAQEGTWTLTAPDGRQWQDTSPIRVCGKEQRERIPAEVVLARIMVALADPPPDRPTDRINLADLRRVMQEWHDKAVSLGFDGVADVLAEAGATNTKVRNEH